MPQPPAAGWGLRESNGVIEVKDGKVNLLRPKHFCEADGKKIDFYADFFVPFGKQFASARQAAVVEGTPSHCVSNKCLSSSCSC